MSDKQATKSEDKHFSLTELEVQMLKVIIDQQAVMLTNMLSFISISRLNVEITEDTQFVLSEDMKQMTITKKPVPVGEVLDDAAK